MKTLLIEYADEIKPEHSIETVSAYLNQLTEHKIDVQPWPDFSYKPTATFTIAHNGESIAIRYKVTEAHTRQVNTTINSSVWEDSCVEFFIALDELGYYNFEFNCIGTPLLGFGKNKCNRELLPEEIVSKVKRHAVVTNDGTDGISWELIVSIPVDVFIHHKVVSLKEKHYKGNFYKCGDLLPEPHFLTWTNIESAEPDFHQPTWFGTLYFQ